MHKTIRAFISYSWDSEQHKNWVNQLASSLRKDGIDVVIDQWGVIPGDQLPHFMERAVHESDFVLIVCTPKYKKKSDSRTGGVGYEGDVITGSVFNGQSQRKFIPILRDREWKNAAPSWMAGKAYIDMRNVDYKKSYEQLILTLHRVGPDIPPLGEPPAIVKIRQSKSTKEGTVPKKAKFRIVSSEYRDQILNKIETILLLKRVIFVSESGELTQQFHHWQDHKGAIELLRVRVYQIPCGELQDFDTATIHQDEHNIQIECLLGTSVKKGAKFVFVFEIKLTNYFPDLFDIERTGFGYSDFPIRSPISRLAYELAMPNQEAYKNFIAYFTLDDVTKQIRAKNIGVERVFSFKARTLAPPQHVRVTIENRAITKSKNGAR